MASPDARPSGPRAGRRLAARLRRQVERTVAERRHHGAYGPGFEDQLDAHGRAMVAARSGPGGHRALPRPARTEARWRRFLGRGRREKPYERESERPLAVLFVVQRYGSEVTGGAELAAREYATRLAAAGHRVEVLTSRAQSAHDWANVYPPGESDLDGVTIHRLGVPVPRDNRAFESLTVKALWSGSLGPRAEQQEWRQLQGPDLPELQPWLDQRAGEFDVVVHFSYLYTPTWAGLPVSSAATPTVLHATAHDEPAFWLPVFDDLFPLPTRYAWFSPEERDLLARRGAPALGAVVGIGVDLDTDGHPDQFRATTPLGDRPYVVFVGRVEAGKGSEELIQFFEAYKLRHPEPLALVFVGPAEERHSHPDIVYTGYVDDQARTDAIAGAVALVQPSFFESFSLVLTEAWAQQRPVLAQGYTDVLVGQVRRSGGGLYYRGFAEFEASLELLVAHPAQADAMGRAGREFVAREYQWEVVLERYEELLRQAAAHDHSPG